MVGRRRLSRHRRMTHLVNQMPLNRLVRPLLPLDWVEPQVTLHSLALILWLIQDVGVEDRGDLTADRLLEKVVELGQIDPREAMDYLTLTEVGDAMVTPEHLKGLGREEAAWYLTQALSDKMVSMDEV